MLAKIKKVKLFTEFKNPIYKVLLECPEGDKLYIKFDYTHSKKKYLPLKVEYNGINKGTKLAWYTSDQEKMSVNRFLEKIALRINKKYNYVQKD